MTQSIMGFKILFSVSIYFSAKKFLQCWTLLFFLNCTLWHLLIQLVWVVHKFWKELPLQQWLLRGSWENQLTWIAGILLNYWGLWQFILAKDCVFTLCLGDEYVPDGIPLRSSVKLYWICLEAMSVFSSPVQLVTAVVHLFSIFCCFSSSFVS